MCVCPTSHLCNLASVETLEAAGVATALALMRLVDNYLLWLLGQHDCLEL